MNSGSSDGSHITYPLTKGVREHFERIAWATTCFVETEIEEPIFRRK